MIIIIHAFIMHASSVNDNCSECSSTETAVVFKTLFDLFQQTNIPVFSCPVTASSVYNFITNM